MRNRSQTATSACRPGSACFLQALAIALEVGGLAPSDESKVLTLDPVERFLYGIAERDAIYVGRAAEASEPWTDDPILQNNYFTNAYGELGPNEPFGFEKTCANRCATAHA